MTAAATVFGGSGSPWSIPGSWDSITLASVVYGVISPVGGKVRIRGAVRSYKIDSKDPQGGEGWSLTYRGFGPKKFSIEFYAWTEDQFDYFVGSVLPVLELSGTKGKVSALQCYHPQLAMLQINQIFVHEIGALEPISDDGMYRSVVQVSEFRNPPPLNVTSTPTAVKSTNQPTSPGVQPNTAVVQRLNILARMKANVAAGGALSSGFVGPI